MRDAVLLPARTRNSDSARAWVMVWLVSNGYEAAAATDVASRIGVAWQIAGSALYGRARDDHHMMVSIRRRDDGALSVDLIGDMTISRGKAAELAAQLSMDVSTCPGGIDGTLRLSIEAAPAYS